MADVRLIDADALLKEHCDGCEYPAKGLCDMDDPICGSVELIKEAPTIDAVPVIRCKDCKMFVEDKEAVVTYCRRGLLNRHVNPDGFCSDGERKDHAKPNKMVSD